MEEESPMEVFGGYKKEKLPLPSFDLPDLNKNKTLPKPNWNAAHRSRPNRGRGQSAGSDGSNEVLDVQNRQWNSNNNRGRPPHSQMRYPKNYRSRDDVKDEADEHPKNTERTNIPPHPHNPAYRPNFNNRNQPQSHHHNNNFSQNNFRPRGRGHGQQGNFRGRGQPANFTPRPRGSFNGHNGRGGFAPRGQHANRGRWNNDPNYVRTTHSAWMTPEILAMIEEKNRAQKEALESQNPDAIRLLRAIRGRLNLAVNDAKYYYNKNEKPNNVQNTRPIAKRTLHYCDTCDRSFADDNLLREHNDTHMVCKLDGCTFTAHPNIILKHIQMQHSTNLFFRVKGYDSPEEIQKWIAERKGKYPTTENIEKKKAEIQERRQRGEIMGMGNENREKRRNNKFNLNPKRQENRKSNDKTSYMRQKRRRAVWDNALYSESTLTSQNATTIITLDSYYLNIEVINGDLVGKNKVKWVNNKFANEGDISDSENSQENIEITDDENDNMLSNVNLNKPAYKKAGSTSGCAAQQNIPSNRDEEAKLPDATDSSVKKSGLLGLVSYSSDSEPEEMPIERTSSLPSSSSVVLPLLPTTSSDTMKIKSKEACLTPLKTKSIHKAKAAAKKMGTSKRNHRKANVDWHKKLLEKVRKPQSNMAGDIVSKYVNFARFSCSSSKLTEVPTEVQIDKNTVKIAKDKSSDNNKKSTQPQNMPFTKANMPSRRRVAFLERLLKDEINTERNYLLQACQFVAEKGLLDE